MGFYVREAPPQGKTKFLIETFGAKPITHSEIPGKHFLEYIEHTIEEGKYGVIVIAYNNDKGFEAAAFAYDVAEFKRFLTQQNNRRLDYVMLDIQTVFDITGLTAINRKPGDNLRA